MSLKTKLLAACGGLAAVPAAIEDYFSAYTYTGTEATQTIVNGIDLAGKGGMVWIKDRSVGLPNGLFDTVNTAGNVLHTDSTTALAAAATQLTAFNSNGFTIGVSGNINNLGSNIVGWSFAQGPKFFKVATVTVSGSNQTVDLSSLGTVGMVTVKRTDAASAWYTWHKDLTAGNLVYLNTTAAQAASAAISVSGTTLTLTQATIGNGTYIVYAWAHDTASTGMIQCGTFTTDGSGNATVNLGWEPQYLTLKSMVTSSWQTHDGSRGFITDGSGTARLYPNLNYEEDSRGPLVTATGFKTYSAGIHTSETYIYLAIRRGPMKAPTVGTQVYNAIARTGTGASATVTGVGFPPDLVIGKERGSTGAPNFTDRLRGATYELLSSGSATEAAFANDLTSFSMGGFALGSGASGQKNTNASTYIEECFRRYPGVFDEVCFSTDGSAAYSGSHNLTVSPEMVIYKARETTGSFFVYHNSFPSTSYFSYIDGTAAKESAGAAWLTFSATAFGVTGQVGSASKTQVAYLFATLAGISKVGSYTGNGSSQTINAGFTTGARFILIKRTDSTGDWFVWDSTRGIVAGNDPHLSLNTTAAEVTTDDSIDPDASGFIVNELAATHINVTSATYIYLAFA